MPALRNFFKQHAEFVGGVATLMSGRSMAAAIALFTMPIVARLFLPSDFGVASVFISIVGIMASIASLRYAEALVLPKDPAEAINLLAFSYRVVLSFCLTFLVFIGIYTASGAQWPTLELLGYWKWALPLGIMLQSSIFTQSSWLTRNKQFKTNSVSMVVGNSGTSGSRIAFGMMFGSSIWGLMVGYLIGQASRLAVQQTVARVEIREIFRHVGWPTMRQLAHRYSDFPKLNAPAGLLFTVGANLPVLLFGAMFSPAIAGFYAMADRLSQAPITIVATSIREVFLQKAVTINEKGGNLLKAYLLSSGGLALLGAIPFFALWLYGQPVITLLLGESWLEAGKYLEIIAPWLFMLWVASPCHPVLIVLRRQRYWLYLEVLSILLRISAFAYAYAAALDSSETLRLFTVASIIGILATIWATLTAITRHSGARIQNDENQI